MTARKKASYPSGQGAGITGHPTPIGNGISGNAPEPLMRPVKPQLHTKGGRASVRRGAATPLNERALTVLAATPHDWSSTADVREHLPSSSTQGTMAALRELRTVGLVESQPVPGTKRRFPPVVWRLTPAGVERLRNG